MPAPSERSCPLCAEEDARTLKSLKFSLFDQCPVAGDFDLVACSGCGLAYYRTPSSQADYDNYYAENGYYASTTGPGSGGDSRLERDRFDNRAELLKKHCPADARVVDVGCGRGGLLDRMRSIGFTDVCGVDPNQRCVVHLKEQLGMQAVLGSAFNLPADTDLLIYSHVIEHIIDLKMMIQEAKKSLAKGGKVYVEVPDASRYGHTGLLPYHELFLEHVNHFSEATLAHLFICNGFKLVTGGQTTVPAGEGKSVPCVWAIFQRGSGDIPARDEHLGRTLQAYLDDCSQHTMQDHIAALPEDLWVWGVSQHAMLLLGSTGLKERRLLGMVDSDPFKQTQHIGGLPIQEPQVLSDSTDCVLIAANPYREQILSQLDGLGFRGEVRTLI